MIRIESGAQIVHKMARSFLVIGIINTIAGIVVTIVGRPGGLFSVFVGVVGRIRGT